MQKLDFSLDLVVIKSYDNVFACFPRFLVLTIWKFELFSQNFFSWLAVNYVWVCLAMYLKPPLSDSLHHIFITRFFRNWSIWIQLEKGWGVVKLGGLQNSKNEWVTNNGGRFVDKLEGGASDLSPLCKLWWNKVSNWRS